MYMQRGYGDAQNFGLTALETKWETLNADAARVVASVVRKVRSLVEADANEVANAQGPRALVG